MSSSDDVFKGMARTLERFKAWLDNGGGDPGWSLEPENHEGWRVVVDERELRRLQMCMCCSCVVSFGPGRIWLARSIAPSHRHHGRSVQLSGPPTITTPITALCVSGDGRKGWLLLRASLHDPLLVLNVESDVAGGASRIAAQVRPSNSTGQSLCAKQAHRMLHMRSMSSQMLARCVAWVDA